MDRERAKRAAARRAQPLPAQIVRAGTPKPPLYTTLTAEQRLEAYWRLIRRAWIASGRELPPARERSRMPGEVFEITVRG